MRSTSLQLDAIDGREKPMPLRFKLCEEARDAFTQDRVAVTPGQYDVSAALKVHMAKMLIQVRTKVILTYTFQSDHPHPAADVVADQVRHDNTFAVDDNTDWHGLSGVKIRSSHHSLHLSANGGNGRRQGKG
jgi:hypothetical protein